MQLKELQTTNLKLLGGNEDKDRTEINKIETKKINGTKS
jgi:hypothetical protein